MESSYLLLSKFIFLGYSDLKAEKVSEVIDRMEIEADYYIEWEDVLDFFTRRGRPKHIQEKIERMR